MMEAAAAAPPSQAASPARGRGDYDAIHGNMLRNFHELAGELGGCGDALLAQVGIAADRSLPGGPRASYRQFVKLLEIAAETLGCGDFGMRLAVRQSVAAFLGPLGDGMRNSRNFGEALHFVSDHSYAHSLAAWIWLRPSLSGAHVVVGHDILVEGLPLRTQAMEYILLVGNLGAIALTGGAVRARRILFRHQPVSPAAAYRRYFGCEVRFGKCSDALLYHRDDLACPIFAPDAEAYQSAARAIESRFARRKPPMHADVRGVIAHLLGAEPCSRDRVALALGLHPRTMLRRLAAEGTTFQQVKDEVRRDRLAYYLRRTTLDFAAMSERLGFAEQAVMTRFCRKWFGASPTALRTTAQLPAPLP